MCVRGERGQALVEFAIVLPVLLALVTAIAELGLTFNKYLTLTDAVRTGARVAATSGTSADATIRDAVRSSATGLSLADSQITITRPAPDRVTVAAKTPSSIALFGFSVLTIDLTSTTTERVEQ